MYDRPTLTELLHAAISHFDEKILPLTRNERESNHQLYFQTLVANNVLRIAEREFAMRPQHLRAEWTRLHQLMGADMPTMDAADGLEAAIEAANKTLCAGIRAGDYDEDDALFEHLKARTIEQLEVANPKLLQALQDEDEVR